MKKLVFSLLMAFASGGSAVSQGVSAADPSDMSYRSFARKSPLVDALDGPYWRAPAHTFGNFLRVATSTSVTANASSTYVGPVVDAYYGLMQVAAIIQDNRLVGIKVLKYPSDRLVSMVI